MPALEPDQGPSLFDFFGLGQVLAPIGAHANQIDQGQNQVNQGQIG